MTTLVSQAEFARMYKVSGVAVNKWKNAGLLVMQGSKVDVEASSERVRLYRDSKDSRATRGKDKPEKSLTKDENLNLNQSEVKKKVKGRNSVKASVNEAATDGDAKSIFLPGESAEEAADRLMDAIDVDVDMPIEEARRVKEVYLALLNRLTYEEKSGKVIDLDLARTTLFECARAARDAWLNWPSRVAPLIAADLGVEADKMTEILTEHVHKQIASLGEPEGDFTAS